MRLRTVNRLSLVTSAIVSSLLAGSGCTPKKAPSNTAPPSHLEMQPTTLPIPTTELTTMPATQAAIDSATQPAAQPAIDSSTQPTTQAIAPTAEPATMPAVAPPTTEAVVNPTNAPAVVSAATEPVAPATAPAVVTEGAPATAPVATQPVAQAASQPTTEPSLPPVADAPLPTDPKIIESDADLADRIGSIAEMQFAYKVTNPDAWPWIWKHQAALLYACNRLAPADSRFPRLEADAYAQLHDNKGELAALGKAIAADQKKLVTPDDFIWTRDLDLQLLKMQTAVEKLDYLSAIIASGNSVPPNVRAHAGLRKAQIQLERGEEDSATSTLADALTTCPRSLECLKLRYSLLADNAASLERVTQLLDLLRANPLQAKYSSELADLVADAGLVSESLPWYDLSIGTLHQQGDPAIHQMLNMAAEMYIADQLPDAMRLTEALLKIDPSNTSACFLQLLIGNGMHSKDLATQAMTRASNVMGNRVIDTINTAGAEITPRPTTRPLDDTSPLTLPDLNLAVAKVNQLDKPELKAQFAESLADLAMLEGYFGNQPDAAGKLVDAIKAVAPVDSPEVIRLSGWNDLMSSRPDDAKVKFSSIATRDPLAELGLIEVMLGDGYPDDHTRAESMGRKLIADHPSGLLGAILWERLHSQRIKLVPSTQAAGLQAPLAAFPRELMSLVDRPQGLYAIHVEPLGMHVGSFIGEPLLAEVRIDNMSGVDLTVGPDGVIKPELIFRVTPDIGDKPETFQAFDNISGPMVLSRGTRIDQVVRIDQTQLLAFLNTVPGKSFSISGTLSLNETVHRLGGYQVSFSKPFFRQSSPLNEDTFKSTAALATGGRPDQQITALTQLQLFVAQLHSQKNPPEGTDKMIGAMLETIHRVRSDELPAVAAWACKCEAELSPLPQAESIIRDMVESDDWRHRQLGLLLLLEGGLDPKLRGEIIDSLAADPQGSIQQDVAAAKGLLALPPSTMPSTMPTAPLAPAADTSTPLAPPLIPSTPPTSP